MWSSIQITSEITLMYEFNLITNQWNKVFMLVHKYEPLRGIFQCSASGKYVSLVEVTNKLANRTLCATKIKRMTLSELKEKIKSENSLSWMMDYAKN